MGRLVEMKALVWGLVIVLLSAAVLDGVADARLIKDGASGSLRTLSQVDPDISVAADLDISKRYEGFRDRTTGEIFIREAPRRRRSDPKIVEIVKNFAKIIGTLAKVTGVVIETTFGNT